MKSKTNIIKVQDREISIVTANNNDYICITDIANTKEGKSRAADIIKKAMIDIHTWMKEQNLKSKMVLQVHDELVFDAYLDEIEILKPKVEFYMKHAIPLEVPMEIGMGTGRNWLEAH